MFGLKINRQIWVIPTQLKTQLQVGEKEIRKTDEEVIEAEIIGAI